MNCIKALSPLQVCFLMNLIYYSTGYNEVVSDEISGWQLNSLDIELFLDCSQPICDFGSPCDFNCPPLFLPPPPPPPSIQPILFKNLSENVRNDGSCNFCHIFSYLSDSQLVAATPQLGSYSNSHILIIAALACACFFIFFISVLIKSKKWKIFTPSYWGMDSCPIFPENTFHGRRAHSLPHQTSIQSPVIKEKSQQNTIISSYPVDALIPGTYSRRHDHVARRTSVDNREFIDQQAISHYNGYTGLGGIYASRPIYSELDETEAPFDSSRILGSTLSSHQCQSMNSQIYHTYSEIREAIRMANISSDETESNCTHIPPFRTDYCQRSLKRQNIPRSSQGASIATPLRSGVHRSSLPPSSYYTSNRSRRSLYGDNPMGVDEYRTLRSPRHPNDATYHDPMNLPSPSNFRISYALNCLDSNKRPLPPVPGVRL